jgi:hypothetical protein
MKKIFIVLILGIFTLNIYSQNKFENVVFIFDKMSDFTNNFSDKETPKEFTFIVKNLSEENLQELQNNISNYRGVTNFTISETNSNNERTANLVLYNYADHWKYYEYLFSKNGIYKIIVNNVEYNPASIGNQ